MAIITLTSDWGVKDHYVASVKGAILSRLPDTGIVDVSHQIAKYDIFQAAFVLANAYRNFPEGSIHIIAVNSEASVKSPHMLVYANKHYFIAADNGVFSLLLPEGADTIYEITTTQDSDIFTFPARDVFAKVACHIAGGGKPEKIAALRKEFTKVNVFIPVVDKDTIRGVIIYIDGYENAITNITRDVFSAVGKGRKFLISFRGDEIKTIHKAYGDVPQGELLALFGATGFLEIAMNRGNASGLLGLDVNETVRIEFQP